MKSILLVTIYLLSLLCAPDFSNLVWFEVPTFSLGSVAEAEKKTQSRDDHLSSSALLINNPSDKNSIIFVGDVLLARNVESLTEKSGISYPYRGVSFSNIANEPYVVGNFEGSIPRVHKKTQAFEMNFSVDRSLLIGAKGAGFTHFSMANNHSLDYGQLDLENTYRQLTEVGFDTFGNPEKFSNDSVTFITLKNKKVALIGLHAIYEQPSQQDIHNVLRYSTELSDVQIVYVHWGNEYEVESNSSQKNMAKQLVEAGADLIIGHHPHVVQEIELINNVPVFYSLGNYIFDQYFSTDVQEGLLLNIDFSKEPTIYLFPITSVNSLSQPTCMTKEFASNFLQKLSQPSEVSLTKFIQSGVLPLDMSFATSSKIAIMSY
jgi:poly-gamma-glutamate synthesis protein (capsule biosynthesis protein)